MQSDGCELLPEIPTMLPGELELPSDDGEPMETNEHRMQMVLLIQSLKHAWADHEDFFVGGNMFVYFSPTQVKTNDFRGPDVFVSLKSSRRNRRSWVAWVEGKLPDVVIELLSDRARAVDRGEKMHIYSKIWRLPEYFLFDPISGEFEGYRLDPATSDFVRISPDERGDLECVTLGLRLGVREGVFEDERWPWLRWLDRAGNPLRTPQDDFYLEREHAEAEQRRAEAERQRADMERQRAEELAARVRELEARLGERR